MASRDSVVQLKHVDMMRLEPYSGTNLKAWFLRGPSECIRKQNSKWKSGIEIWTLSNGRTVCESGMSKIPSEYGFKLELEEGNAAVVTYMISSSDMNVDVGKAKGKEHLEAVNVWIFSSLDADERENAINKSEKALKDAEKELSSYADVLGLSDIDKRKLSSLVGSSDRSKHASVAGILDPVIRSYRGDNQKVKLAIQNYQSVRMESDQRDASDNTDKSTEEIKKEIRQRLSKGEWAQAMGAAGSQHIYNVSTLYSFVRSDTVPWVGYCAWAVSQNSEGTALATAVDTKGELGATISKGYFTPEQFAKLQKKNPLSQDSLDSDEKSKGGLGSVVMNELPQDVQKLLGSAGNMLNNLSAKAKGYASASDCDRFLTIRQQLEHFETAMASSKENQEAAQAASTSSQNLGGTRTALKKLKAITL